MSVLAPTRHSGSDARSYKLRRGRITAGQDRALRRLWPTLGVAVDGSPLDLPALFGRRAPVVLEIGSGMGEATAALASAEPERDLLAVELHPPGLGRLLNLVEAAGLTNVRVADGNGLTVLREMLPSASLTAVRVFFPDPWPKTRHVKRRLVDQDFAALVADRLVPGGLLHVATDWAPYAAQVRRVLADCPALTPVAQLPARPRTRYEQRGRAAGRPSHDVGAVRVTAAGGAVVQATVVQATVVQATAVRATEASAPG